ncbi:hypothetical protein BDP81DRAFT_65673 [Colletotrichum phormii]|uniref:Secreted protein n=1 Tax=Colletotrichum phormii TaxID=359342 RepID=A0AAI9ZLC4_9PEZI|nr:uncharacterized protein BDP81DRAFT_65673 [Colletotrichum phormii]KAK1634100.1 hypothetical protein BDP81DRAFT_65673 [Colletotrichum phormii]
MLHVFWNVFFFFSFRREGRARPLRLWTTYVPTAHFQKSLFKLACCCCSATRHGLGMGTAWLRCLQKKESMLLMSKHCLLEPSTFATETTTRPMPTFPTRTKRQRGRDRAFPTSVLIRLCRRQKQASNLRPTQSMLRLYFATHEMQQRESFTATFLTRID